MVKQILSPLFVFIILCVQPGCKNDLDLLSDYEQKFVCYGLLDPSDTVHYIRVSKVFLGEGNALVMAQQADSIQPRPENIVVTMTRLLNGVEMASWTLVPDTTIPRDEGIFLYPFQTLYRGNFPVYKDGSTYRLTVTDIHTGETVSGETPIVKDVLLTDPSSIWQALNFADTTVATFKFVSAPAGKRTQLVIRFHYSEQFIYDTTQVSQRHLDWIIGEIESRTDEGNENLKMMVRRDNFLRILSNNIPANNQVQRVSGKIDFIFTTIADDVVTYRNVQIANSNTSADLPPFTNLEGGLGLFSSRNTTAKTGYLLDQNTVYALRTDPRVQSLNFVR